MLRRTALLTALLRGTLPASAMSPAQTRDEDALSGLRDHAVACPLAYAAWRASVIRDEDGTGALSSTSSPSVMSSSLFDDDGRKDDTATQETRAALYAERCAELSLWNEAHAGSDSSFWLGPNPRFIDRLPEELATLRPSSASFEAPVGHEATADPASAASVTNSTDDDAIVPVDGWIYLDWRDPTANPTACVAVTGVKDQGPCGACWAFSVMATLEGAVAIQTSGEVLVDLSEQELLDCDVSNGGCGGGNFNSAYDYVEAHGVGSYGDYPWRGSQGSCEVTDPDTGEDVPRAASLSAFATVAKCDVGAAMKALVEVGPLSVSVDASCDAFLYYGGGVMNKGCGKGSNNHAVTLVGFNVDANPPYWVAKNSWGPKWGLNGYLYLAMALVDPASPTDECGISGVLRQPLGVPPSDAIVYLNHSTTPIVVDGDDGFGKLDCANIAVFGTYPFDDDGPADSSSASVWCQAANWLAEAHGWLAYLVLFAVVIVATALITAAVRCCVRKTRHCCQDLLCCWCCPKTKASSGPSNAQRRGFTKRGARGEEVSLVYASDGTLQSPLLSEDF